MNTLFSRRTALQALALLAIAPSVARARPALPTVEVYKSPACGCCGDWMKHLKASGFADIRVHEVPDTAPWRARFGLAEKYGSCHTALIDGYAVEGHVPARDIKRLLAERPKAVGLAVPGMPVGSPGMDGPEYKGVKDRYDVLLVDARGAARVWASY